MSTWHQSWIEDILICPERYRRNHETDEEPGTSAASLMGTAVHDAMAGGLNRLRVTGEHLPIDTYSKLVFNRLATEDRNSEDPIPWRENVIAERTDEVSIMAKALWAKVPEILEKYGAPVSIEQEFSRVPLATCSCGEGITGEYFHRSGCVAAYGIELEGTWDVLTEYHWLIDWKTSDKGWPPGRENVKVQPLIYALAVEHLTGEWPHGFVYVIVTRKGKVSTREVNLDKKRLAYLEVNLPRLERMRREGIYPLNPSSSLCSPIYCPWYLRGCPAKEFKG
jgi:CRISPR/Cas system-associated exonuclease Cas4 (RecB family)